MISFLSGTIHSVFEHTIWLNVHDVGYEISIARSKDFKIGMKVFLYTVDLMVKENRYLVGFLDNNEKCIFLSLLKVNGIGPKTALKALASKTPDSIAQAIRNNDINFLKEIPSIGQKGAQQILIDLKGKVPNYPKVNLLAYDDAFEALKSLGYKSTQINKVLSMINTHDMTCEEIIRFALNKLGK